MLIFPKNKKRRTLLFFTFLSNIVFLFFLKISSAKAIVAETTWPTIPWMSKDQQIVQGKEILLNLPQIVQYFFYFALVVSGLLAFIMIVWGGVQWMTSAGNPSKMGDAKDRITSALLGLVLLLASYLLLKTINPDILTLQLNF